MQLFELLNIHRGITSFIGSGGKTTLIRMLAYELMKEGKVVVSTTTHIYPFEDYMTLINPTRDEVERAFKKTSCLCIGKAAEDGKLVMPDIPFSELKELADFLLIEADGSKQLPLKAHMGHEPELPVDTGKIIEVIGADGFGKPVWEVTHRVEQFCKIAGCTQDDIVTPKLLAKVINGEHLCDIVFINKVDDTNREDTIKLSKLLNVTCFYGALWEGKIYGCSH